MEFRPMSPEEIERTVQFLLHQQAQFAADFEKLSVKTDRIADGVINLSVKTDHLADGLIGLTSLVGRVTDSVGQLAAAQQRTDQQVRDTSQQLAETDTRLSEMIRTFERHVREDHGRRPS